MPVWKDVIGDIGGVGQILRILTERFAPDAIDSIFQDMVKFMFFERTGQNMDTCKMKLHMSRQRAEARMIMGSGPPLRICPGSLHATCRTDQK